MKFSISENIFNKFPLLLIGAIFARSVNNDGSIDQVHKDTRELELKVRNELEAETLSQHPKIATWREAYRFFGVKPKDAKSSVESLYRSVLRGNEVRSINPLVDIYNYISLKYRLPVGGEDTDKLQGDLELTIAGQDEPAVQLLGDQEPQSPEQGEVIYRDSKSAVCRRWNWREADRTKLTTETTNCIFVIESIPPATRDELEKATQELQELIKNHCAGQVSSAILNKSKPELDFKKDFIK